MKKTIIMTFACVLMLSLVLGLSGCAFSTTDSADEKSAVCFVLGNTANSQGLNLTSPLVQDTIYDVIRNYGYISVVNCDGNPDAVMSTSFDIDARYKNASSTKLDSDAQTNTTNLLSEMATVVADDPEVDYLGALSLAVRSLSSLDGYDSKTIVVVGAGLSTTGALNFQNNLLSADANTIVDLLKEKSEIPDFSGLTVVWQQLGDVASPQQELTSAQKNLLQEIYSGIVEAGGGTFVYDSYLCNAVNEEISYPAVSVVDLPADTPISFSEDILSGSEDDGEAFSDPVVLSEEQVTFVADSDQYTDEESAITVLTPIADYLIEHPSVKILLVGTTAGDTNTDGAVTLSQKRAEAVRESLINLDVDQDQVLALGLGSDNPWHVYGAGYDGAIASSNRAVYILDATSETAQELLAQSD
jgi:outer membrane protein OmpA-like peptidoglycan-associated protein